MKIKCMLDNIEYNSKPKGTEIGKIQNRLEVSQKEISVEELAYKLSSGCTFKPAFLNGRKTSDWLQQQVFALDFDENTTIEEQLNLCQSLNIFPSFGYTSFNHTDYKHKFRLVFVCDCVIYDINLRNKLQLTLLGIFNKSDQVTFDASRLFFGGKKLIYENYNSTINAISIINNFYKEEYEVSITKKSDLGKTPLNNNRIYRYLLLLRGILLLTKQINTII